MELGDYVFLPRCTSIGVRPLMFSVTPVNPGCPKCMVKVLETSQLSVSVAVKKRGSAEAEFGRVRTALLDWHKSGRAVGGSLTIDIRADRPRSSEMLHSFMRVVSEQDPLVSEIYSSLGEAMIRTVSPAGKIIKKIGFVR
jgi:hypothetical protein